MTNLYQMTHRKCLELKLRTKEEVIEMITGIEKSLLSSKPGDQNNGRGVGDRNFGTKSTKWCTHHKNTSHNTSECYTVKKAREKQKKRSGFANNTKVEKSSTQNFVIQMIDEPPAMIRLEGTCNNKRSTSILLDTGSHYNMINKKFLAKNNLNTGKSITVEFGKGSQTQATLIDNLSLTLDQMPNHTFNIPVYASDD